MNILPLSQCSKGLDFKPRQSWPEALPAWAWNKELLCAFGRAEGVAVDLAGSAPFLQVLRAIYPSLALGELARLRDKLNGRIEDSEFFAAFGLREHSDTKATFDQLLLCPPHFVEWVDERQLGIRELAVLRSFQNLQPITPVLEAIAQMGLSRGVGQQVLELAGELVLMDEVVELPSNPSDRDGRQWLKALLQQRRPQSLSGDQYRADLVRRLPWPSQVQADWSRQGDESGLNIQFRVRSPQEWRQRLKGLEQVLASGGEGSELWSR